jgi:hypothetical protein
MACKIYGSKTLPHVRTGLTGSRASAEAGNKPEFLRTYLNDGSDRGRGQGEKWYATPVSASPCRLSQPEARYADGPGWSFYEPVVSKDWIELKTDAKSAAGWRAMVACERMPKRFGPVPFSRQFCRRFMNQQQRDAIEYLREENRVLRTQFGGRRLCFTDDQRLTDSGNLQP